MVKPKRGRPATGRDPSTAVRLPKNVTAALDRLAAQQGTTRSHLIRAAIAALLKTKPK